MLDGAHNPDGAAALAQALADYFPAEEKTLILGLFSDKSWQNICDALVFVPQGKSLEIGDVAEIMFLP